MELISTIISSALILTLIGMIWHSSDKKIEAKVNAEVCSERHKNTDTALAEIKKGQEQIFNSLVEIKTSLAVVESRRQREERDEQAG